VIAKVLPGEDTGKGGPKEKLHFSLAAKFDKNGPATQVTEIKALSVIAMLFQGGFIPAKAIPNAANETPNAFEGMANASEAIPNETQKPPTP